MSTIETETSRDPSIDGFCLRHHISRSTYYNLKAAGRGPREYAAGGKLIRISAEAEADWIKAREAEVAARTTSVAA